MKKRGVPMQGRASTSPSFSLDGLASFHCRFGFRAQEQNNLLNYPSQSILLISVPLVTTFNFTYWLLCVFWLSASSNCGRIRTRRCSRRVPRRSSCGKIVA